MRNPRRMVCSLVWVAALAIPLMFGAGVEAQTLNENLLKGVKCREIGPFRGCRVLAAGGGAGGPSRCFFGGGAGGGGTHPPWEPSWGALGGPATDNFVVRTY